jgi:hypothetical protein
MRAGIGVLVVIGMLMSPMARAEPVAPAVEEARALFKKGDYQGSLDALERAQASKADPRLFWNMAACETKLGHHAKAMAYVERYLGSVTGLTRDERTAANDFLTAAHAYVGEVTATSNVAGTEVSVDGAVVGTTPFAKPVFIDEGSRHVRFAREGYVTVERDEKVLGGTPMRWAVELAPVPQSQPASAPPPSRVGPIALGGAGVLGAGIGGLLVGISLGHASTLHDDCSPACAPSRWEKFRTLQITGDVLIGVGAAAIVGAVVWWVVRSPRVESRSAWVIPGGVTW